jgi:acyl-coenzyme A synthetase/AMP-(fatty) acid ligase
VIDEGDRVRVLLAGAADVDVASVAETVRLALERVGAHGIPVTVDLVDAIPRTPLGKAPLIRRAQLATAAH